ncbi:conserved hypothetical protein [Trichinella spiralis]|uniref:hypothetical protein n=1 Tax=Trichinella spiralis TaxID=6334 RepID=UPI0001EFC2A2|nr:conserved hypothetical protein [Trichinella spiralis]
MIQSCVIPGRPIITQYPTQTRRIFSVVFSTSFLDDVPSWYSRSTVPSPLVIVVLYPTRTRRIFSVVLSTSFLGDVPSLYYKKHSTLSAADRYYQQHSILSAGDCGFASNVDSPLSPCSRLLSRPEVGAHLS